MSTIILSGLAAVLGALLRYGMLKLIDQQFGWTSFKVSTMLINVSGAFLLGLFTTHFVPGSNAMVFSSGLMGGYTTFSTYMNETLQFHFKHPWMALMYFASTLIFGLLGAMIGLWL